jgi:glucose/arabinose dehydrogenase
MSSSWNPVLGTFTRNSARLLAASVALGLVAACGGGGGGGAPPPPPPPPPPVNQAPAFSSANSATTLENNGGAIYQAAATDPEGSAVAFSIVGGADAARFNITPNGQLAFSTPPNFDLPTDADGNNVYQVEIAASDGQNRTSLMLSVTVTNSKEGIAVRRIATGFNNPAAMTWVPRGSLVLIADKDGAIYSFDSKVGNRLKIAQIPAVSGPGVLSIAVPPDGTLNSIFVMYTNNGFLTVEEIVYDPNTFQRVQHAAGPVLRVAAPDYAGGGWLGFDPQGNLIIATGDAGGTGDPSGSAQDDSSFLGKIIRVGLNPSPFDVRPRYYPPSTLAKGLHQPVGGTYYSAVFYSTGFAPGLTIGDRGQAVADEVDFLANGASGINFGWPFKEGFQVVRGTPPAGVADPVADYPRPSGAGLKGIIGGAYAGRPVSIAGDYVFADRSGSIFTLPVGRTGLQNARTGMERRTADFAPDVGAIDQPVAIVADGDGRLLILDGDGEIFAVDAA